MLEPRIAGRVTEKLPRFFVFMDSAEPIKNRLAVGQRARHKTIKMKKVYKYLPLVMCVSGLLFFTTISTYAQSLNYAKSLIELGKYLEAAKQLRPLADGGNAEAQYLAANLFFTGRGVTKNVAQGEKYAKLSANQGYEDAIILLSTRYFNSENHQQLFSFLSEQIDKHPYMETEVPGSILALCYTNGYGTEKNYYKGYRILSQNEAWMAQLEEKAPEFASVAPSIISKFSISNVYGCDQGSQNRTPVYASNEYVGVN